MKIKQYLFQLIEKRLWLIIIGVAFRIILELSYKDFVHPLYEYAGFSMTNNSLKYIESWGIFIGIILFLPGKARKPSDYLVCIAFFSFLTPLLIFYGFTDGDRWVLYFVLAQYLIMNAMRIGQTISIQYLKFGQKFAWYLTLGGIFVATIWMFISHGVSNFNLDLEAVYDFREEANNTIYVGVLGYIVVWTTTVCGPLALALALRSKRYFYVLGIFVVYVLWFGISSHKSVLFYPLLVLSFYILFKYSRALSLLPLGLSLVVVVSLISYYFSENILLSSMLIRRVFFVPSHLTFTYFEFFDQQSFVLWSNSFLSWLIEYPYDQSVALVIGNYLNDSTLWANNSFFSTGYMHAGIIGVIVYGVVAGITLKILDSLVTARVPLWMSLSIVIVPFYNLFMSSDLTTTLLSHGLGFGIFMLYLMGERGAKINASDLRLSQGVYNHEGTSS